MCTRSKLVDRGWFMEVCRDSCSGILVGGSKSSLTKIKLMNVGCLSSQEIQLHRLMARDKSSREDASSRLRAQMPITDKLDYADIVIDNSGPIQELEPQLHTMLEKLKKKAGWSWRVSWVCPPWGFLSAMGTLLFAYLKRNRRLKRSKKRASNTY